MPDTLERSTGQVLQLLRFTLGGTAVAAGADKFLNLLTDWERYLAEPVARRLPMSGRNFMRVVGAIEIAAGATLLRGHTRVGGYIAGAWLLGITANLLISGDYDVAARDLNMAAAAFALARLSEARQKSRSRYEELERAA